MTLNIGPNDLRLQVSKARTANDDYDFRIPSNDLSDYSVSDKAGDERTSGTIVLSNQHGAYTDLDRKPIHLHDRIRLQFSPDSDPGAFGEGPFGAGATGGWRTDGDYLITNVNRIGRGADPWEVEFKVSSFADGIMGLRHADFHETGRTLSGQPTSILNQIINDNCPELSTDRLPLLPMRLDYFCEGKFVDDVVAELADRAAQQYGSIVTFAEGPHIRFEPAGVMAQGNQAEVFGRGDFKGEPSQETSGQNFYNNVRVLGGIDDSNNIADSQPDYDTFVTVSESDMVMSPLVTKKSEISTVDIYTKRREGADDGSNDDEVGTTANTGVRVRIQLGAEDGSGPIEPGNPDADIVHSGERRVAYDDDGFTTFRMGEHHIPDRQIWLIEDTPGDPASYDIGVDSTQSNRPAYKAFFPKPVGIEKNLDDSVDLYREIDGRVKNEALATGNAVRDAADASLARHGYPTDRFEPEFCRTDRAHNLNVGEVVEIDGYQNLMVDGLYYVSRRKRTYAGPNLDTELTFIGVNF